MRNAIINRQMNFVKKYNNYDNEKLEIVKYGLESIYILITKTIVILTASYILGLLKETLLFLMFYNIIRTTSFGLHATKSWICYIASSLAFIGVPFICKILTLPLYLKVIISICNLIFIIKNAPADTAKRPIISKKRRQFFKILSSIITIIMCMVALFLNSEFISNSLILSITIQCFMISPTVYKIFGLSYDNYKNYI